MTDDKAVHPSTIIQAALAVGGGILPSEGCFSAKVWALFLGCNANTIRSYIDRYDIPYIQPGDERFVEAADMKAAFPKLRKSTAPVRRRRKVKD